MDKNAQRLYELAFGFVDAIRTILTSKEREEIKINRMEDVLEKYDRHMKRQDQSDGDKPLLW